MKAEALLNESVGAGYIDRNWPPAFKDSGAWPLASLRQSFLNGALTRLLDPDARPEDQARRVRRPRRLRSGVRAETRRQLRTALVFRTRSCRRGRLRVRRRPAQEGQGRGTEERSRLHAAYRLATDNVPTPAGRHGAAQAGRHGAGTAHGVRPADRQDKTIKLSGNVPAELWNRLGTRVLPKLRTGKDLKIGIEFSVTVEAANANDLQAELKQILTDLGLQDALDAGIRPDKFVCPCCLGRLWQHQTRNDSAWCVRDKRTAKGLSLRKFAELVGVSPTYVSQVEHGNCDPPTAERVRRMAEILGENTDELTALAGRVPADLPRILQKQPAGLAAFIREVSDLTPEQLQVLAGHARRLKDTSRT